jgi:hypothetical protein
MSLADLRRYHKGIGIYRPDLVAYREGIMEDIAWREAKRRRAQIPARSIA